MKIRIITTLALISYGFLSVWGDVPSQARSDSNGNSSITYTQVPAISDIRLAQKEAKDLELVLVVEKEETYTDRDGKSKVRWVDLGKQGTVRPGDLLRYRIRVKNNTGRPLSNIQFNQPIPGNMVYLLESAEFNGAKNKITFSIDGGRIFVGRPRVTKVKPGGGVESMDAPANRYTHVQWSVEESLPPGKLAEAIFKVRVK